MAASFRLRRLVLRVQIDVNQKEARKELEILFDDPVIIEEWLSQMPLKLE